MSYATIYQISISPPLRDRLAAAAASEGVNLPGQWVSTRALHLACSPGWAAAWESALVTTPDANPGADDAVITDGMILAAVQADLAKGGEVLS